MPLGAVVAYGISAYLTDASLPSPREENKAAMRETVAPPSMSRSLLIAAAAAIVAVMATVALWAHYGATVFFETIRAGFVACFG